MRPRKSDGPLVAALLITSLLLGPALLAACSSKSSDRETRQIAEYHADFDIAMTVSSIADALSLGEPLDTLVYNYEGIMTDGQGSPLYTDWQGMPGRWSVEVTGQHSAVIRNLETGDLFPEDLHDYIVGALQIDESHKVYTNEYADDDETDVEIYDFNDGILRFETRRVLTPSGRDSYLCAIILMGK